MVVTFRPVPPRETDPLPEYQHLEALQVSRLHGQCWKY